MDFISQLSIFVLAIFVGYFVVWSVTPALHTPLMAVTNAISSVIIVGALIAAAPSLKRTENIVVAVDRESQITWNGEKVADEAALKHRLDAVSAEGEHRVLGYSISKLLGLIAVVLASVNIFGGFAVTRRMLGMYKKKEKKVEGQKA